MLFFYLIQIVFFKYNIYEKISLTDNLKNTFNYSETRLNYQKKSFATLASFSTMYKSVSYLSKHDIDADIVKEHNYAIMLTIIEEVFRTPYLISK